MTAAVVVFFAIGDIDKLDKGGILAITGADSPLGSSTGFFLRRRYTWEPYPYHRGIAPPNEQYTYLKLFSSGLQI